MTGPPENASPPEQRRRQLAQLLRDKARQSQTAHPASMAQRGVWFMQQVDSATHAYHLPFCVRVLSGMDADVAKSALQQLVDRHAMLRTTFHGDGRQVEMLVRGAGEAGFAETDARGWPDEELLRQAERSLREPFDLRRGPLVRLHLFHRGEADHVFLLVLHHLICDGHALTLLLDEFMECYEAGIAGRTPQLRPRAADFPELIARHRQWMASPAGEKSKAYWLERLAGEIPRLGLPATHPRREPGAPSSAVHSFEVDETLSRQLAALAQSCGVTLFNVLLAAYQTLLMRLSGQQDILVGVPMLGRTEASQGIVVGHFVNLVAIRGDLSGDPAFRELIARTWPQLHGAVENQEFPYPELVRLLRPGGSFEPNPLFRTMLNILKPPAGKPMTCMLSPRPEGMNWGALRITHFPVEALEEHYDLSVRVVETRGYLQVKMQYDAALFDAGIIERFAGVFLELLKSAVADPDKPLSRLETLSPAERGRMIEEWNATAADYPRDAAVHQLLAEQAARTPEAAALVFGETKLSYGELDRRANQLARYLRRQGLGRDDLVAVCAERSQELVIALLGVLKAGAAYVPVDPTYPAERVKLMLEDSGARLALTTQSCDHAVGAITGAPRFRLDRDWPQLAGFSCEDLPSVNEPLDLAYVIYTSGSTGRPRGVQIPHRALVNFLWSMRERPGLNADDVLLSVTTYSFDIFGLELFLPLLVGARLELAGADEIVDAGLLARRLAACGATVMQATPVTWRMLLDAGFRPAGQFKALCGGEALPTDLAGRLLAAGFDLWNMYGPTETTVWSCVERVREAPGRTVSIGRPIANTQAYVLDAHLQPAPAGVVGRLYLGGDGLARGYLHRPELTAEKFVVRDAQRRIYDTGDLARFLPDGRLECVGRTDCQVKIRGFRVELEEIEAILNRHPGVSAAAVAAKGERDGSMRLIGYIVAKTGAPPANELREFLRLKLPDYMAPSAFIPLEALPLTPNGKIDRKRLPDPDHANLKLEKVFVAPRNEPEVKLAKIWEEVFGIRDIGVRDDFFDLGGHSLLAVQLVSRIAKAFDKSLPLSVILQARNVERLAAALLETGWASSWYSLIPIQPRGSRPPLFGVHDLHYKDLVKHLGTEQPIYGLRYGLAAHTRDGVAILPRRIEDLAAHYVKEMRSLQPEGPYHLIGLSFGGVVAFEMAQQLNAQGQQAAMLALIDSYLTPAASLLPPHLIVANLIKSRPRQVLGKMKNRARQVKAKLNKNTYQPHVHHPWGVQRELAEAYVPRPYAGNALFFKALEPPPTVFFQPDAPELAWKKWMTGNFQIHEVSAGHIELLEEPHVQIVAEKIRAGLSN